MKLGTIGFGGPVALVGYMHRDLVEQRKWISEADYKERLTLAQLMPGPLAAQLAIYLGFVHYSVWRATLVGVAFVSPSFLMVLALGWAYLTYGGLSWMQAVFYGVGACVIGIITISAYKLTRKTLGKDWLLWTIYVVSAATTIITVGFIGYIVTGRDGGVGAGLLGASVAALATFLPCYLLTIIPAPDFKQHGKRPGIVAFVDGVTAAAIGALRARASCWDVAQFFRRAGRPRFRKSCCSSSRQRYS